MESRPSTWERSFNWSPDGNEVLAGTFDGTVLLWDAASGRCRDEIGERGAGNACFNDIAATDRGEIATVSDDGVVRLGRLTPSEAVWTAGVGGVRLAMFGSIVGAVAAVAVSRIMQHLIWGVVPYDPATLGVLLATLTLVAATASFVPAARVGRMDPARVLRDG